MADVATHSFGQVPFHHKAVSHSPSPVGFGFGLSASPATPWSSLSTHAPLTPWNIPSSHPQLPNARPTKRRLENDDDDTRSRPSSDDGMDRSPTPERPKRAAPKRARTVAAAVSSSKEIKSGKETKRPANEESDVDVGVLLGKQHRAGTLSDLTFSVYSQPPTRNTLAATHVADNIAAGAEINRPSSHSPSHPRDRHPGSIEIFQDVTGLIPLLLDEFACASHGG